jgi:thioredoxin-related protein
MSKSLYLIIFVSFFSISLVYSQNEVPTEKKATNTNTEKKAKPEEAQTILERSFSESKLTGKNIFLIFHASWCSWCKRLDKALESEDMKLVFDKYFIITHLDVLESKDKLETLENPGGRDILAKCKGMSSGLPFYVFFDSLGNVLANSNVMPKDQNIGYPGSPDEIEKFAGLIKNASSAITVEEIGQIKEYLKNNAPKINSAPVVPAPVKPQGKVTK